MNENSKLVLSTSHLSEVWDHVVSMDSSATFFHTRTWSEILCATFPQWEIGTIALEFNDGTHVVMPLLQRKLFFGLGSYKESMLPGVYGGPLYSDRPSEVHRHALQSQLFNMQNIVCLSNPFSGFNFVPSNFEQRNLFTQVLDLKNGYGAIFKAFRKGHIANISSAQKKGVTVTEAKENSAISSYNKIYQESLRRWGESASGFYPMRLFSNLFAHFQYGKNIRLWLATLDGQPIAGAWLLYQNEHVVYWHGVMDSAYSNVHPVHLLIGEAIRDACESGFRWFDFNPSGGLAGVAHFKNGYGAQRKDFIAYRNLGNVGRAFRLQRYLKERYLRRTSL